MAITLKGSVITEAILRGFKVGGTLAVASCDVLFCNSVS